MKEVSEDDAPKKPPRARRTRGIIAWVLVVLASLLIPISVISAWAITTVTNTDQYVATMAPLARNEVIVQHLANKATDELFSTHVVQNKVTDLLPPKAKPIVQPIVTQVKTYVHGVALKVFSSEQFGKLFDALNRRSHQTVIDILSGKQTPVTKALKNGQVVLNLTPQLNQLVDQLNSQRGQAVQPDQADPDERQRARLHRRVEVPGLEVLGRVQHVGDARVGAARCGGGARGFGCRGGGPTAQDAAAPCGGYRSVHAGAAGATRLRADTFLNQASSHRFDVGVAAAVWDTLIRFLKADLRWTLLGCVLVALGAWLAGPARYAVWIRTKTAAGARWLVGQGRAVTSAAGRGVSGSQGARKTGAWITEHVKGLRILGVVIAALVLVLGDNVTGWDLVILVIVLAVYLGLLQMVVYWARRVTSDRAGATPVGAGPPAG